MIEVEHRQELVPSLGAMAGAALQIEGAMRIVPLLGEGSESGGARQERQGKPDAQHALFSQIPNSPHTLSTWFNNIWLTIVRLVPG